MRNLPVYIDLAFCLVVLPVMMMMFPVERWYHHFRPFVVWLAVWLYSLYFINRLYTVPSLFKGRRHAFGAMAFILLSVGVTWLFSSVRLYSPHPSVYDLDYQKVFPEVQPYQQAVWSLFMIVEAFSFAVGLLTLTGVQFLRRREAEAQRDKARLALYDAHIRPHFMFNTLNSLYGLFLTHSGNALSSLEKFISLTRYLYTTAAKERASLAEETDYIRRFVDLQSLRLNSGTKVDLHVRIEDPALQVPPMLLLTFVENCFKHGVSPDEPSRISISIEERKGILTLHTSNAVFAHKRPHEGKTGIENCRKRLELCYPDAHSLDIKDANGKFEVELIINLKNDTLCSN